MEGFALYFYLLFAISLLNLLIFVALVFNICKLKVHFIFTFAFAVLLTIVLFKTNLYPFLTITRSLITLGILSLLFICLYFYNNYKSPE